jgi:hypothetical protein
MKLNEMSKSDFYHQALLAVAPVVTQAYILKHSLPFVEDTTARDERIAERAYEIDAIAEVADRLAKRLADYWKSSDEELKEEES